MTVIFGAGGTAGHVFIAMGIAQHVKDKRILITDQRGAEYLKEPYSKQDDEKIFDEVHVLPIRSASLFAFPKMVSSFVQCLKIFSQNKPSIYFGCGAYTSLIAGLAAGIKRAQIQIYQGDQVIGTANKILQHLAKISWTSSDNLEMKNKQSVGCVVRGRIKPKPMQNDGFFRILILGSSIGSSMLEYIFPEALSKLDQVLKSKIWVTHQNRSPEDLIKRYQDIGVNAKVEEFLDTTQAFADSHLIIARSGWSLLSDIVASERAAILIPWADAKHNHQYHNALWMSEDKEWVLEEEEVSSDKIAEMIEKFATDMFENNANQEFVTSGILSTRAQYIKDNFSANAGEVIGKYLSKSKR